MFGANKTVFILGAGASWHYGYPTGEDLVKRVIAKARIAAQYFTTVLNSPAGGIVYRPNYISRNSPDPPLNGLVGMKQEWMTALNECTDIIGRLSSVDPLVIDYFLGQNPHLGDIGKFLIAWVLLESEAINIKYSVNINRPRDGQKHNDNWYRFVIHQLVTGCHDAESLIKNNVSFLTFNYDVSLELRLFRALSDIAQFSGNNNVTKFFENDRIIHIYGKIREKPMATPPQFNLELFGGDFTAGPQPQPGPPKLWIATKALFDTIYEASKGIQTIAPFEKTHSDAVNLARRKISEASRVYILGYGFDENNSRLLDMGNSLKLPIKHKAVMFTNYLDSNVVNKRASRVFFDTDDVLLSGKSALIKLGKGGICEKSIRNIYDALALDFDST
jgi:hypothetical protein